LHVHSKLLAAASVAPANASQIPRSFPDPTARGDEPVGRFQLVPATVTICLKTSPEERMSFKIDTAAGQVWKYITGQDKNGQFFDKCVPLPPDWTSNTDIHGGGSFAGKHYAMRCMGRLLAGVSFLLSLPDFSLRAYFFFPVGEDSHIRLRNEDDSAISLPLVSLQR
jgi:hypothetical protein